MRTLFMLDNKYYTINRECQNYCQYDYDCHVFAGFPKLG
jgi:hypothetical protein